MVRRSATPGWKRRRRPILLLVERVSVATDLRSTAATRGGWGAERGWGGGGGVVGRVWTPRTSPQRVHWPGKPGEPSLSPRSIYVDPFRPSLPSDVCLTGVRTEGRPEQKRFRGPVSVQNEPREGRRSGRGLGDSYTETEKGLEDSADSGRPPS